MGKNDEKCVKKSNLLVYQQPAGKKKERKCDNSRNQYKPPICTPTPKQIRVCTGADMKRMCPPQPCVCTKPKRGGPNFFTFAKFGMKAAIAAAAVYVTYDMGIWGTADDSQEICRSVCTVLGVPNLRRKNKWDPSACNVPEEADMFRPIDVDPFAHCNKPPIDLQKSLFDISSCWNKAVTCFFMGIVNFPNIMACKDKQVTRTNTDEPVEEKKCVPLSNPVVEEKEPIRNQYK